MGKIAEYMPPTGGAVGVGNPLSRLAPQTSEPLSAKGRPLSSIAPIARPVPAPAAPVRAGGLRPATVGPGEWVRRPLEHPDLFPAAMSRLVHGLIIGPVGWLVTYILRGVAAAAFLTLIQALKYERRRFWTPAWWAALAAAPIPVCGVLGVHVDFVALWLTVSIGLFLLPLAPARDEFPRAVRWAIPRRVFQSGRERVLLARLAAGFAWWHDVRTMYPVRHQAEALAVIVTVAAIPWLAGRKVRAHHLPWVITAWHDHVSDLYPDAAGVIKDWEETQNLARFAVALHTGAPSKVASMDEAIEIVLDKHSPSGPLPRGSVDIAVNPRASREIVVTLFADPGEIVGQPVYGDGSLVTPDGRFPLGRSATGLMVYGRLWRKRGGTAFTAISAPGGGKGVAVRNACVAAARSKDVLLIAADCKGVTDGGSGIPEVRAGCDIYAKSAVQWRAAVKLTYTLLQVRAKRYGDAGQSGWNTDRDPLICLVIDELARFRNAWPECHQMLDELSSLGRALGITLVTDTQRGDSDSMGKNFSSNVRGGGITVIGSTGTISSSTHAAQDSWGVDPAKLPKAPGWMYALSKIDTETSGATPIRIVWYPSDEERADGLSDPAVRTCEEWLTETVHCTLHPDDMKVLGRYRADYFNGQDADPHLEIKRPAYGAGATLDDKGRFVLGYTIDGDVAYGSLWRPRGSTCTTALGAPGSGKGVVTRNACLMGITSEHVYVAVADCKGVEHGGAGIPEVRAGVDLYGRTREQWGKVIDLTYDILRSRAARYGENGWGGWTPDRDPLWLLVIDEIARFSNAYRSDQTVKSMEEIANLGRSLGIGMVINTQHGDAASMISTKFIGSVRGAGTVALGVASGTQSQNSLGQDLRVNWSMLPRESGWMFVSSSIDVAQGVDPYPVRMLWYPSREEIDMGVVDDPDVIPVEEYIRHGRKTATLHEDDQAIVDAYLVDFYGTPAISAATADTTTTVTPDELMDENGKDRVLKVLAAHPDGLVRSQIAERAGLGPTMTSRWLKRLAEQNPPAVAKTEDDKWRAA